MLIKFTDDYENYIFEARQLVGRLIHHVAIKEPYVGSTVYLDRFYACAVAISAIIDHIEYDDNVDPQYNEYLLQVLIGLLDKNLCGTNSQLPDRVLDIFPEPVDLNSFTPARTFTSIPTPTVTF